MYSDSNHLHLSSLQAKNSKQRDRKAFEKLYDEYSSPLFSLILSIVADPAAADMVLEKVFKIAWLDIEEFNDQNASMFTWLYAIARKEALFERKIREVVIIVKSDIPSTCKDILHFRELVDQLPEPSRTILLLSYFEDCNDDEIATALNADAIFVKTSKYKGLNIINKMIARAEK